MLYYCKRCGRIVENSKNILDYKCDCCKALTYPVPEKYWLDGLDFLIDKQSEQLLRDELVKTSLEFDSDWYENRDKILAKQSAEFNTTMAYIEIDEKGRVGTPKCPTCQSTNIRSISGAERGASILGLGIFSKKINKSFKCNSCGYTW